MKAWHFLKFSNSSLLSNHQSQKHKEAGGKKRGRSDSQSSGKKEKSSFVGLKKMFHGLPFARCMHSQKPSSGTCSRFKSSNFHKCFVCVLCSRILPEKTWTRKKQIEIEGLGGVGWWSTGAVTWKYLGSHTAELVGHEVEWVLHTN